MAAAATTVSNHPNGKRAGLAGGFLQALIRGVKTSRQQQPQPLPPPAQQLLQQQAELDIANAENASVLTRAQKRRLSSEILAATTAAGAAAPTAVASAIAAQPDQTRRALNSLSNVNRPQQQQRRASKRRSGAGKAGSNNANVKRTKRAKDTQKQQPVGLDDIGALVKLSQESNLGIRALFSSSQEAEQKAAQMPVALCMELASRDSVLANLARTCRYLDHYPYALESFFLDQDLEEVYRRDLPLVDFLQPQELVPSGSSGGPLRWDMLRVLIDWLVNAHESLELNYETLYLTVKLVYMHLSRKRGNLPRQSLQLLAIAALWIASKKEELFAIQLKQLTYLTLDEFSPRQVISMEQQILSTIDFRINWPLSYNFLRRFLRVVDHDNQQMSYLARYLLELSLLDHQLNLERESGKAAAALWLARAQLGLSPLWPQHLRYSTAWTETELLPVARRMNELSAQQLELQSGLSTVGRGGPPCNTYFKYSNAIFKKVALTPALPVNSELLAPRSQLVGPA